MGGDFANYLRNLARSPVITGNLSTIYVHKYVDNPFPRCASGVPACPPNKPHKK